MPQQRLRDEIGRLLPRLRRFACSLTGSIDAADDLVQAALERALSRLHQWQPGSRLDSWLFRIVQTVWLNELRSRRLRTHQPLEAAEGAAAREGERSAEARVMLSSVRAEFERLPAEQRQALLLVCVEGYTHREAAELLDVPIGTVISRLARGRAALIERLDYGGSDETDNVVKLGNRGDDAAR